MYAGTLVQGKTRKTDFRCKVALGVDSVEWDRKSGAHEAIVDRVSESPYGRQTLLLLVRGLP